MNRIEINNILKEYNKKVLHRNNYVMLFGLG